MRNFLVLDLLMKTNLNISHLLCIMSLALGTGKSAANESLQELEVGVGGNIKSVAHSDHANEKLNIHIHPLWGSHYVTEGRDNLPGSALASIAGEINYNDFTFIPWLATGTDNDYDELNLNAIYSCSETKKENVQDTLVIEFKMPWLLKSLLSIFVFDRSSSLSTSI